MKNEEKNCWGFTFWWRKNPSVRMNGRGFVGKDSILGEKLGKDALWGRKHDSFPVWGRIALHLRGKKAWLLPHVVKESHVFREKKAYRLFSKKWLHLSSKNRKNKVAQKILFWTFFVSKHIISHGSAKVMNTTIPIFLY